MSGYRELDIYIEAFKLAGDVHKASLLLPKFELYEQGSQIRRSSKSIKDQIAEGYGRKRYKADFVKFLVYAQASCDETISQLEMIKELYMNEYNWGKLIDEYTILGKKINKYIQYVENNWRS
jgi:four helix bundle protein